MSDGLGADGSSADGSSSDGFSAAWLSLREPHDAMARARAARRLCPSKRLAAWQAGFAEPSRPPASLQVLDLGCGSGANLRWLAPRLAGAQDWTGIDHDPRLLEAWQRRWADQPPMNPRAAAIVARTQRLDLAAGAAALAGLPTSAPGQPMLITASALLDLVSEPWLQALARACRARGAAALFALSVDGLHRFSPAHEDDALVLEAFAAHQRRDKGFGPALGGTAPRRAARLWRAQGYQVHQARSDWRLDAARPADQGLLDALVDGTAAAAAEQQPEASARFDAWRRQRQAQRCDANLRHEVGHLDLLALP